MDRNTDARQADEDLLRQFRAGEQAAFDRLVLRYRKEVYRVAYRLTGNHAEADDLAQETFCRAYTGLSAFRGESTVRTWLLRIVWNLSLNVMTSARVSRREGMTVETLAESGDPRMALAPAGEARLLGRERSERLQRAIAGLPGRQKSTLMLRAFEGLPYRDIARVMGCSIGTAKANFFHAVASLRRELKDIL